MVLYIVQNLSNKYFSHNSNIKYVDSTIKDIHTSSRFITINPHGVLSFMIFSDCDYIFLSVYC